MGAARRFGERVLLPLFRGAPPLRDLAVWVTDRLGPNGYGQLRRRFIENGRASRWDEGTRAGLVRRFEDIHDHIDTHSTLSDALIWAEASLSMEATGPLVECGTYAGGSTAKLSILARLLGQPLLVFDSFEGLPPASGAEVMDYHPRYRRAFTWQTGANRAGLEQVKASVQAWGEISACTFHKGWFRNTLTDANLPAHIGFAYTDVVLAGSAVECFTALWPRLADRGVYFSRDIAFARVLQALLDERLWRDVLHDFPPILFGAGYGLRDTSPHLGFMVKGKGLPPEYLNRLMIDKVTVTAS